MVGAIVDGHPHIDGRIPGKRPLMQRLHDTFFDGRHEISRNRAADDFILELEPLAARQRTDFQPTITILAMPAGLALVAGVLLRAGQAQPDTVSLAIDTASAQGWRRPLLAWLGVARKRAEDAGDREAAAALERRMRLTAGER